MGFPAHRIQENFDVYRFHSFRELLKSYLEQNRLSLSELSSKLGLSLSHVSMVLTGSRNLSEEVLGNLTQYLAFSPGESAYLKLLWVIESSPKHEERLNALKQAHRHLRYQKINSQEIEAYEYLTQWYYVAIRELAVFDDFEPTPSWIREHLDHPVPASKIKDAIEFLTSKGYIDLSKRGRERISKEPVDCSAGVYRVVLTQFHSKMLELQRESLETLPASKRHTLAYMLSLPEEGFQQVKTLLNETIQKISEIEKKQKKSSDGLYYIHLGALSLASTKSKKKRSLG